ncbi:alpha-D-ribose 1-methylphosphonate 5-triphosphate diphosphatase [Paenibacillus pectinilyticus]|uniref:Alpha-D-ribose 1-methylphosphonate 5-triphosphate diphosphatase n=1 Tax=Paenibacillus pectinilyticus TaxID=512399 RepID=A0A1C0ZVX1_9BACL|nr:phosphonate metabolism protein PhnM [Paenibacillus pectinilyticus]OCT12245.1 alpha-D-ribose 1-methylphosphonate 5-triphosphate diphosphatase [Paenibacillus pectinilyticus]
MYIITNGIIITEEALLEGFDLIVEQDRISKIVPKGSFIPEANTEILDANGGYVTPGLIDIHSDYIEHMTAPRPTSLIDFRLSLRETEKELIGHGITTMFHSLSIFKSVDYKYRPIREPENVRKLVDLIDQTHTSMHLVRHRFHARFEIDNLDEIESLKQYINEDKVHLLSFMDHTPGQGQYRDLEMYKKTIRGYEDVTDENVEIIIANHQSKPKMTIDAVREIAEMAKARNIAVASHDDDSVEKLDLVKSFGTTISEFPITLEIARKAKEKGLYTIAGAPNVILGGSHSGNLSASEAVQDGSIDILCSDYYPAAMLHAVFQLASQYNKSLVDMFKLVTLNPAKAVNMDDNLGSIREGKKADLLIIERLEPDDFPVITAVMVDGKLIQKTNYRT